MAYFRELGSTEQQINELLYDNPSQQSFVGIKGLKNSDVLTGVTIVAGDIARFPIVKKDLDGNIIQDADLNYLMNVRATKYTTAHLWKFAMAVNTILTGNGYSRVIRDPVTNKALEYEFYAPSSVIIRSDDSYESYYYELVPPNGKNIRCEPEDMIHWKFFTSDTIHGRSPLLSLTDEINLQEEGISTLIKFFRSGFSSGVLKLKGGQLSGEARKVARREFDKSREGSTGGSPIVLDSTMEYLPLEVDTNVLSLINSNNYSTAQIAKCLRIPGYKLGVTNPNQSVKQLNDDYILNDLPYYFNAVTSEHQMKNLDDDERKLNRLEFDTRSVTGRNSEEIKRLVDSSLITANEGRVELGKTKSDNPDMDRFQSSLNYVFLDQKEKYQEVNKQQKGGDKHAENGNSSTSGDDGITPVGE